MIMLAVKMYIQEECDHRKIINDFAITQFNTNSAHEMSINEFNIDGGLNDVRAYWNKAEKSISIICRYKKDLTLVENRVLEFAKEQSLIQVKHD